MTRPALSPPRAALGRFAADERGGPTVEFVVVFATLAGLMIFAFQAALSYFFTLAAADAAERTARLASTLPIAHCAALRNAEGERVHLVDEAVAPHPPTTRQARFCLNEPSPCQAIPGVWTCTEGDLDETGGPCDAELFRYIASAARLPGVKFDGLEVSWTDSGLGEVGGPVVPLVSVTVKQPAFPLTNFRFDDVGPLGSATSTVVGEAVGRGKWEGPTC